MVWRNLICRFLKVWGCDAYVKKFQADKLEPKADKCIFIGHPKQLGIPPNSDPKAIGIVSWIGSFLEGKFVSKNWVGGWWRLDEVIEPSLQPVCSRAQEVVPVAPTPIEVEAYDSDHEVSDQVTAVPRRVTRIHTTSEWYSNPVLKVMLLDNNEPTSYGEAMVGPYSDKWLEAMKSEIGSMYHNEAWTLVDLPDDRQAIEINGSLRRRRTWTVMSPSMKLDLWRRVFFISSRSWLRWDFLVRSDA